MLGSLFAFLMSLGHGGEWHSIGAAPAPPYVPPYAISYTCQVSVIYGRGRLSKREEATFQAREAISVFDFEGQTLRLSFARNSPEDYAVLSLSVRQGKSTATSTSEGPLASVSGAQSLSRGDRSVTMRVGCVRN